VGIARVAQLPRDMMNKPRWHQQPSDRQADENVAQLIKVAEHGNAVGYQIPGTQCTSETDRKDAPGGKTFRRAPDDAYQVALETECLSCTSVGHHERDAKFPGLILSR
jgi:hypothetical protein